MPTGPAASAQSLIYHCRRIAQFSDESGVTTRTFLSPAMRDCLLYFKAWADRIGMPGRIDAAGNFRAVLPGSGSRRLLLGSHLDSVPHAGAFDGVLGVVMGMLLAESFQEKPPACTLEVIGFSEEEGVRFQRPFIGSIAFAGGLDENFLNLLDANGISIRQAIENFGLSTGTVHQPQMEPVDAYLEFHIEQGPLLESLKAPLGIVDAIAGQSRASMEWTGLANHAGTTPMSLRRDAFCAAAEWALLVEQMAQNQPGLVATVGKVHVAPDAVNIVPGRASLSMDLRHADDRIRRNAFDQLMQEAQKMAARRQVQVSGKLLLNQNAVPMDAALVSRLENLLPDAPRITSGAGHDAMILAPRIPSAMIFLRSPAGISHHPDESVLVEDVAAAFQLGQTFVQNF